MTDISEKRFGISAASFKCTRDSKSGIRLQANTTKMENNFLKAFTVNFITSKWTRLIGLHFFRKALTLIYHRQDSSDLLNI